MPGYHATDGTRLAYHVSGAGVPLVCLPGGPMRASAYLGDLGGLSARRQLIMLDLRGTGGSAVPADPGSYRCDRLSGDVCALLDHLGLDSCDVLAHSAGANVAVQFVVRHPERARRLVLITPSGRAVDIEPAGTMRQEIVGLRRGEPWFADAAAAFGRIAAGESTEADWLAIEPFMYGRWDAVARAHSAADKEQANEQAARAFAADGAFDPGSTRAGLRAFSAPVMVLAGGLDLARPPAVVAEFAGLFPAARLVTQPGAGHYPWLDDPCWFVAAVGAFLDDRA